MVVTDLGHTNCPSLFSDVKDEEFKLYFNRYLDQLLKQIQSTNACKSMAGSNTLSANHFMRLCEVRTFMM